MYANHIFEYIFNSHIRKGHLELCVCVCMYTVRSVLPFLLFISGLCVYTMEPIGLARDVDFMQPADGSRYRTADYMTYLAQLVLGMLVTYWLQYKCKEGLSKLSCISAFEWITIISNVAGRVDKLVHDEVYICDGTDAMVRRYLVFNDIAKMIQIWKCRFANR